MVGNSLKESIGGGANYDEWLNMAKEVRTGTGDDLKDAEAVKEKTFEELLAVDPRSPESDKALKKHADARNTVSGIKEAREKYLKDSDTHETNLENVSIFGDIDSSGFESVVPKAVGSPLDDGIDKEVYPQLEGENDREYAFRIAKMREESYRHKQGDAQTNANINEILLKQKREANKQAHDELIGKFHNNSQGMLSGSQHGH